MSPSGPGPDRADPCELFPPDFEVYAFLKPFGLHTMEVRAHPKPMVGRVGAALTGIGVRWEPVGMIETDDGMGQATALLAHLDDELTDQNVAAVADDLCRAGIGAFGYVPFHDHEFGHTHLFRRAGTRFPRTSDVVFVESIVLDADQDTREPGPDTDAGKVDAIMDLWCFGSPATLAQVADVLPRFADFSPASGPDGIEVIEVLLDRSTLEQALAQSQVVVDALVDHAGLDVHIAGFDRRSG